MIYEHISELERCVFDTSVQIESTNSIFKLYKSFVFSLRDGINGSTDTLYQ